MLLFCERTPDGFLRVIGLSQGYYVVGDDGTARAFVSSSPPVVMTPLPGKASAPQEIPLTEMESRIRMLLEETR